MSDFSGQPVSPDPARTDEGTSAPSPTPALADLASAPLPPLPDVPAPPLPTSAPKSQADSAVAPRPSSRPGIRLPKPKSAASKPSVKPAAAGEAEVPSWLSDSTSGQLDVASSAPATQAAAAPPESQAASQPKLTGLRDVLFALGLNNPNRYRESGTLPDLPQVQPQHQSQEPGPATTETGLPAVQHETPAETARVVVVPPELPPPQADAPRRDRRDRRDAYDEVEILPSWRGQYKRKD